MSERERLIELIKHSLMENIGKSCKLADNIADCLLENGVIVPLVKIGNTVYHFGYSFEVEQIEILQDEVIYRCGNPGTDDYMAFGESDIGKTVFLTKKAAEKALKGGAG